MKTVFPPTHHFPGCEKVFEFALASLVYHSDFLKTTLPANHMIFSTPLFSANFVERLKPKVISKIYEPTDPIRLTGVPSFVNLASNIRSLAMAPTINETIAKSIFMKINDPNSATSESPIAIDDIQEGYRITEENSCLGAGQPMTQLVDSSQKTPCQGVTQNPSENMFQVIPSKTANVPSSFEIPHKCSLLNIWQQYIYGNNSVESPCPPLKDVVLPPCSKPRTRKRLCDIRFICEKMIQLLKDNGQFSAHPSIDEVNHMFGVSFEFLNIPMTTKKGRERRIDQLSWETVVRILRERDKILKDSSK
eukprot:TRINITY_DN5539_c0_g1_i2.p1 TRINITY_DN5539_c0_g1~~TRINITY_DN5539_c0_g1_i2.p1  ORF type:complete len:306 (-),score=59.44 TRINITY_DN5539_c0_g1_i2:30-947(-)